MELEEVLGGRVAKHQYLGLGDTKLTFNPNLLAYDSINPFKIQLLPVDNVLYGHIAYGNC